MKILNQDLAPNNIFENGIRLVQPVKSTSKEHLLANLYIFQGVIRRDYLFCQNVLGDGRFKKDKLDPTHKSTSQHRQEIWIRCFKRGDVVSKLKIESARLKTEDINNASVNRQRMKKTPTKEEKKNSKSP